MAPGDRHLDEVHSSKASRIISGIDATRRALAGAVVALARELRSVIVAEGIEKSAELAVGLGLGIDAGQGYLLGRPSTDEWDWRDWARSVPPRLRTTALLSTRS